jgi:type IV pilus assembly protein PilE
MACVLRPNGCLAAMRVPVRCSANAHRRTTIGPLRESFGLRVWNNMKMETRLGIESTTQAAAAQRRRSYAATPWEVARLPARGFTLIEMLITVATLAITAAIELPNYIDYVTRSKIVEATSNLSDMRVRLEQYYADNRQYPASCATPATGPAPAGTIYLPASSKYFAVTCALSPATYTVTATGDPAKGMASFVYTVDQSNRRRTTSLPSGWAGAGVSSTCWVSRKSGDC